MVYPDAMENIRNTDATLGQGPCLACQANLYFGQVACFIQRFLGVLIFFFPVDIK